MDRKNYIEIFILIIAAFIIIIISSVFNKNDYQEEKLEPVEIVEPEHEFEYGIIVDSLIIIKDKVRKNQFLSDILLKYKVNYVTIDKIARASKPVFDVRKIRRGNNYSVICSNDSINKLLYFVYEKSPTKYIVYDLTDSVCIYSGEKEIEIRIEKTTGTIISSFWNAMLDNNCDPNLANELSEVFAWTIDFFGIQKGDIYNAIYEALYVDNKYIGLGNIQAAKINHSGDDYFAFYFIQDSVGDYFDEEANSLMRTFLKAPLRYKRISSRYSHSRMHPILKIRRPHHGVDYAAATGTPVLTIGDGIVVKRGYEKRGGGNYLKIKHNGTYTTSYMHLSKYAQGMKKGARVKQGDVIGYVGKTGLATGPHLDFRIYRNGKAINPLKLKSPPAKPVDSIKLTEYNILKDSLIRELNKIYFKK
ncbi:MAG: peptidoglycan DD-metalloendopeptidase family protein [Bacteroidales bacterium]|nr:peptidoglycan DD-metalloendopeptidase family protein [Bacteroidales bacterium]